MRRMIRNKVSRLTPALLWRSPAYPEASQQTSARCSAQGSRRPLGADACQPQGVAGRGSHSPRKALGENPLGAL